MIPVNQKYYCRPSGESTKLFTDDDFPSVKYNPWVFCWGWPALYVQMWMGVSVTQTLLMFLKMTQYQTHKHYIADFLRSRSCFCQSHDYHVINSMAADVLTTQGARSPAAMVLAGFSWNIPVSAPEELIVIFHFIFNAYGSVFLLIANRCLCHSR